MMKQDFGEILKQWEQRRHKKRPAGSGAKKAAAQPDTPRLQQRWLEQNGVIDKDREVSKESPAERRRRLKTLRPQDRIDLHLLTRDEAWSALQTFFTSAKQRGLEKVLIIHGKGLHSEGGEGVLRNMCKTFLEQCELAGESGRADNEQGGSGATWVLLK